MHDPTRRRVLASGMSAGIVGLPPPLLVSARPALAYPARTIRVGTRVIEVHGRAATVFGMTQPDGRHGLVADRTSMAHPMHLHGHHFRSSPSTESPSPARGMMTTLENRS